MGTFAGGVNAVALALPVICQVKEAGLLAGLALTKSHSGDYPKVAKATRFGRELRTLEKRVRASNTVTRQSCSAATQLHSWCGPSSQPRLPLSVRATSSSAPARSPETYDGMPKILVFGGNGFVGSRVCEQALTTGLGVVSISRSGRPKQSFQGIDEVQWVKIMSIKNYHPPISSAEKADVFDVSQWRAQLEGTIGIVSCLGAFGSNDFMYKMCGESNATIFREAAKAGVARASFISAADLKFPDAVLRGYFKGKRHAEQVLWETFPEGGVALRPSFVFGTRQVGGIGVPLQAIGLPFQKALSFLPNTKELAQYPFLSLGFIPPSSVSAVAKAAVAAATDPAVPTGFLDAWAINKYEEG